MAPKPLASPVAFLEVVPICFSIPTCASLPTPPSLCDQPILVSVQGLDYPPL